jgi:hypothetical protein
MHQKAIIALGLLALASAGTARADEGATISKRLEAANYTVVSLEPDRGPKPVKSFYVVADYTSKHAFAFYVYTYRDHATAERAETGDYVWLDAYGTPGASQLEVDGRVLYWGATGPMNHGSGPNPTLPPARFRRMVALARGG